MTRPIPERPPLAERLRDHAEDCNIEADVLDLFADVLENGGPGHPPEAITMYRQAAFGLRVDAGLFREAADALTPGGSITGST